MFNLKNKVVIITRWWERYWQSNFCLICSAGGACIYLDVDESSTSIAVEEIERAGGQAIFRKCNVAIQKEVQQTISAIGSR